MLGFAALVVSILAVVWARKNDILAQLETDESRDKWCNELLERSTSFDRRLKFYGNIIDRVIGTGIRIPAFCLMLSLFYCSAAYLFSIGLSNSFPISARPMDGWPLDARITFVILAMLTVALYALARINASPKFHPEKPEISTITLPWFHLAGAALLSASVWLVFRDVYWVLAAGSIAGLSASIAKTDYSNRTLVNQRNVAPVASGAALGAFGMLLTLALFVADDPPPFLILWIVGISVLSAALCWLAMRNSILETETKVALPKGANNALSATGRPSLFVGLYCTRAAGSFSIAVAILLLCVFVLREFYGLSPVLVSAAILMTCAIFAAGATSVAGAGYFAFGAMLLISAYLVSRPDLLYSKWQYIFAFWVVIPFVNMATDSFRWWSLRQNIKSRLEKARHTVSTFLLIEVGLSVLGIVAFAFLVPNALRLFNYAASISGYGEPLGIEAYIQRIASGEGEAQVWVFIMLGSVLLPSLVSFIIFLSSGSIPVVPREIKEAVARDLSATDGGKKSLDTLAWRLSIIDSLSGVIIFFGSIYVLFQVVVWISPSFAGLILFISKVNILSI